MKDIYGNEERVSRRVLNYYNIYSNLKLVENTNGEYFNFNNFELVCLAYINLPLEYYINELCIGLNITHNGEWNLQFGNWVKKDDFIDFERQLIYSNLKKIEKLFPIKIQNILQKTNNIHYLTK